VTEDDRIARRRAGLAAEAHALMSDPDYVREAREVAALMEALRDPRDVRSIDPPASSQSA
jgi:hypothetical protein